MNFKQVDLTALNSGCGKILRKDKFCLTIVHIIKHVLITFDLNYMTF